MTATGEIIVDSFAGGGSDGMTGQRMVNATTLDAVRIECVGEGRAVTCSGRQWVDFRDELTAARATADGLLRDVRDHAAERDRLRAELLETAAWLEERADVLTKLAADMPGGGPQSAAGVRVRAVQVEAARLRGRAALLRQAAGGQG